jgi:hypothetical protein
LVDIGIPLPRNIMQKEAEKKLKYKNLSTQIQQMWSMKRFIIPVIIGTTRIVTKGPKNIRKQY